MLTLEPKYGQILSVKTIILNLKPNYGHIWTYSNLKYQNLDIKKPKFGQILTNKVKIWANFNFET